jgi:ABC-type multidrug transport system ATPase subunit
VATPRYRLDARGLSYQVGPATILSDVSLSLRSGELVALLGPSGSGKSTLLTTLIGFRRGTGRVELSGRDLYRDFEALKTSIGFVPQDDVVPSALTVGRTLEYAALLRLPPELPEGAREKAVRAVLAQVELSDRAEVRIRSLSGGQRKRVSLAVELLAEPPLIFLDEPTSGLDPDLEDKSMAVFRRIADQDRLVVVSTHVLASLDKVDLAIFMCKGRLVYVGPPTEAAAFFEVPDFPSIYRCLAAADPELWMRKLRGSPRYRELVLGRLQAEGGR